MSDHDHQLLAQVKAEGRRRKRLHLGSLAAVVAVIAIAGAVSAGGSQTDQQVRVAAPGTTTTTSDPLPTTTTGVPSVTSQPPGSTTTTVVRGEVPRQETTTTTTERGDAPIHGTTRHAESGLTLTLVAENAVFGRNERVRFTLMVTNDSTEPRVYDASPGPRLELVQGGERRWDDGCGGAYPAVFHTERIAPGQTVTFHGEYPSSCPVGAGSYGLTGIFSWCPVTQPRESCERIPIEPIAVTIAE